MADTLRLDQLEVEVIAIILQHVDDTSPKTTNAVELTNKYLNSVVQLIKNRHKKIHVKTNIDANGDYEPVLKPDSFEEWAEDDTLLHNLRTLTVDGNIATHLNDKVEDFFNDATLWQPIVNFISKIGRLRLLIWNLPRIPIVVLNALHDKQPFAKLQMYQFQPSFDQSINDIDRALADSPALTHLRSHLQRGGFSGHGNRSLALRRIIAKAPLEYAGVINREGDVIDDDVYRMQRRLFLKNTKPCSTIKTLTLDGYPMTKKTLEDWAATVDFTSLENLKFSRGFPTKDYFENAATMLPNLKHVSLNFRGLANTRDNAMVHAIQEYLCNCSPLETISLWSWAGIIELKSLLDRHGPTLKSLQLHEREAEQSSTTRRVLSLVEMQYIADTCKLLKDFTFDLQRTSAALEFGLQDSNIKYFEILKGMKLDSLQIYFDQGVLYMIENIYNSNAHWFRVSANSDDIDDDDDDDDDNGDDNDEEEENDDDENSNDDESDGDDVNSPAAKRQKVDDPSGPIRPSKEANAKAYVEKIWQTLFRDYPAGPRKLEVKFGEWEILRANGVYYGALGGRSIDNVRQILVRPAERDDQLDQCLVKCYRMTALY